MIAVPRLRTIQHPITKKVMRTPLIVGMDPGAEKGYALVDPEVIRCRSEIDAPQIVAMGCSLSEMIDRAPAGIFTDRPVWACVEFQYAQRVTTGEISADSIIKLAFRAGYMLAECLWALGAEEHLSTVPQRWKNELFAFGATKPKHKFTRRLMRNMQPDELKELQKIEEVDAKFVDDVVDAIGIAWAVWHVCSFPARFAEWRCDADRIIPLVRKTTKEKRFVIATDQTGDQLPRRKSRKQ